MHSPCLFCGGDRSAPDHAARCDGRQGAIEAAIPDFDGETYERERDRERLRAQLTRVYGVMRDHAWRTLADIAAATNDPEASVTAPAETETTQTTAAATTTLTDAQIKAVGIRVYNNSEIAGLATQMSERLTQSGWNVVANCSNGRERWVANVRLKVQGERLTWSSERGSQAYVRCEPGMTVAQAN